MENWRASANPVPGLWQKAQETELFFDNRVSKYSCFPSSTFWT
jgi:hypothetical protein